MIQKKNILIVFLILPIVVLLCMTGYRQNNLSAGRDFTLPIIGFDPRDLLAGHYLTYTIDYGIEACHKNESTKSVYICMEPRAKMINKPADCKWFVHGECNWGRFTANLERFYIPEDMGKPLEEKIRNKKGSIVITVTPSGNSMVKDLLIDGQSWKQIVN
jgi:uncharacterized membrane-anchored protein